MRYFSIVFCIFFHFLRAYKSLQLRIYIKIIILPTTLWEADDDSTYLKPKFHLFSQEFNGSTCDLFHAIYTQSL